MCELSGMRPREKRQLSSHVSRSAIALRRLGEVVEQVRIYLVHSFQRAEQCKLPLWFEMALPHLARMMEELAKTPEVPRQWAVSFRPS